MRETLLPKLGLGYVPPAWVDRLVDNALRAHREKHGLSGDKHEFVSKFVDVLKKGYPDRHWIQTGLANEVRIAAWIPKSATRYKVRPALCKTYVQLDDSHGLSDGYKMYCILNTDSNEALNPLFFAIIYNNDTDTHAFLMRQLKEYYLLGASPIAI